MTDVASESIRPTSPSVATRRGFQMLLLTAAASAAAYARIALSPLQESMRIALPLSDNQIALLQGPALAFPLVIASVPLGLVIDRYSRARLIFIFAAFNLFGSIATALAPNFVGLFAARCLIGLTVPATAIAAYSLLSDFYAPSERGRATMIIAVAEVASTSAAFALGGALLAMFGSGPNGWRWTMLALAAPVGVVMVATLAMREPPRTGRAIEKPSPLEAIAECWRYRAVIAPLLAGTVMVGFAEFAALVWAAPTLSRTFVLPPARVGGIMAMVLLVSGVLGPIAGGALVDLCQRTGGPRRTMSALGALALLIVPASLFAVMPVVASSSLLLVIFMTLSFAIGVMVTTLSTIVIPNELRGLYLAVSGAISVLFALGLAPIVVSVSSNALGGPAMIGKALALVCLMSSLLCAGTFAVGRRWIPERAIETSTPAKDCGS